MENELEKWARVGAIISTARDGRKVRPLSVRAKISEGYWRQLERGYEKKRGVHFPVNPSREVLARICGVVGADPEAVFKAAGIAWSEKFRLYYSRSIENRLDDLEVQVATIVSVLEGQPPAPTDA